MLESFDPNDSDGDFEIQLATDESGQIYLAGLSTNLNPFFRDLVEYFRRGKANVSFAYSKEENIYRSRSFELTELTEQGFDKAVSDLRTLQASFGTYINPIILGRVLEGRPDMIIIGSSHGEFLHRNLLGSAYAFVDDEEAGQAYIDGVIRNMKRAIKRSVRESRRS